MVGCGVAVGDLLCRCTVGGWSVCGKVGEAGTVLGCGRGLDGGSSSTEESVFWPGATVRSVSPTVWARSVRGGNGLPVSLPYGSDVGTGVAGGETAVATVGGNSVGSDSAGSLVGKAGSATCRCTAWAGASLVAVSAFRWCSW